MIAFLMIVIMIASLSATYAVAKATGKHYSITRKYGVKPAELETLSDPAKSVLALYNSLPASNRPQGNMTGILKALDRKYGGVTKVSYHFGIDQYNRNSGHNVRVFDWDHRCYRDCSMPEYKQMKGAMEDIVDALANQEYQLEMAGLSGQLENAKHMIEQMKTEVSIIEDTTKELTK